MKGINVMNDKEFDELIKEAGTIAINKMTEDDLKNLNKKLPFKISKNFKKQMKKIVKHKENSKNFFAGK